MIRLCFWVCERVALFRKRITNILHNPSNTSHCRPVTNQITIGSIPANNASNTAELRSMASQQNLKHP